MKQLSIELPYAAFDIIMFKLTEAGYDSVYDYLTTWLDDMLGNQLLDVGDEVTLKIRVVDEPEPEEEEEA